MYTQDMIYPQSNPHNRETAHQALWKCTKHYSKRAIQRMSPDAGNNAPV